MTTHTPAAFPSCQCCNSDDVATILYGMPAPSEDLDGALADGRAILGGCDVPDSPPQWHCNACGTRWAAGTHPFADFELSSSQAEHLSEGFRLVLEGTDLSRCAHIERLLASKARSPGIYVWVMRHEGRRYRIYAGKTISLTLRLSNYIGEFQPHSPNDFKLRVFRDFMSEAAPQATLDWWFADVPEAELTARENETIRFFDPLLNRRLRPSADARQHLRDAFSTYYRSSFAAELRYPLPEDRR